MNFLSYDLMKNNNEVACEKRNYYAHTMSNFHYHNHYEILYVVNGERELIINEESIVLNKSGIVIIKPGILHKTRAVDSCVDINTRVLVNFSHNTLSKLLIVMGIDLISLFNSPYIYFSLTENKQEFISQILENMSKNFSLNMKKIMLLELLNYLLEETCIKQNSKISKAAEIKNYIDDNTENDLSLEKLSGVFYLTKEHIARIFKKEYNKTVKSYINGKRAEKAKRLLKNGYSVTDTAFLCGFSGICQFERVFFKETKQTPKEYKKCSQN